ncbi:hypothetical protein U9M48_026491 [Paspalum notatum var. saurae]|uniref:Uncharacterized protein n=1 Tax=Paspalum notatum var. saurae TaxID=547442 RepID=A0AAQ3TSL9_PASNO
MGRQEEQRKGGGKEPCPAGRRRQALAPLADISRPARRPALFAILPPHAPAMPALHASPSSGSIPLPTRSLPQTAAPLDLPTQRRELPATVAAAAAVARVLTHPTSRSVTCLHSA